MLAGGALTVMLKDAIKPNLMQTLEGTPVFVHAGSEIDSRNSYCSKLVVTFTPPRALLPLSLKIWLVVQC